MKKETPEEKTAARLRRCGVQPKPREIRVDVSPDRVVVVTWCEDNPHERLSHIEHGGARAAGDFVRMLVERAGVTS